MLNIAGAAAGTVIEAAGSVLQTTATIGTSIGAFIYQPPGAPAPAADEEQEERNVSSQQASHPDDAESESPDTVAGRARKRLMKPALAAREAVQTRVIEVARAQAVAAREEEEMGARDAQLEAEAKQRLEARLARQQAELRSGAERAPDTTRRVFQCRVSKVACENVSGAEIEERFFIRFVLGMPALHRRSSGVAWAIGTQPPLRTATVPAGGLAPKGKHTFPERQDDLRYWLGSYDDLEVEELLIEVWSCGSGLAPAKLVFGTATRRRRLATHAIPLQALANGSVEQEVVILTHRGGPPLIKLRLVAFFEELCEWRLQFVHWRGTRLRASDLVPTRRPRTNDTASGASGASGASDARGISNHAGAPPSDGDAYGNTGSSDPYVVFSIDPPPPSEVRMKMIRHGGYFGRTTRTDVVLASLEPEWSEARRPLAYLGTRTELENEVLKLRVYDWDALSPDDLIGHADVPMAGVLDYGTVEARLALREEEIAHHMRPLHKAAAQPRRDQQRDAASATAQKAAAGGGKGFSARGGGAVLPAGTLCGRVVTQGWTPRFKQIGAPTIRRPGIMYLAVRLISARGLRPADPNGFSDPFVVVSYGGATQSSRVVPRTLEPCFEQTLYLPALVGRRKTHGIEPWQSEELLSKGDVQLSVYERTHPPHPSLATSSVGDAPSPSFMPRRRYDHDDDGHDELGFASVPIAAVMNALLAKVDDEADEQGRPYRGRVLKIDELKLALPGYTIDSSLQLWCYFTPDLPLGALVDPAAGRIGKARAAPLDAEYAHRANVLWRELPKDVSDALARAHLLELGGRDQLGTADRSGASGWRGAFDESVLGKRVPMRIVSGVDEHGTARVLPELLVPILPPRSLARAAQVARMVRCVTWTLDDERERQKEGSASKRAGAAAAAAGDIWHSVRWLLDVQRGGLAEHALLMVSLLLGMGCDAYVCVGRLHDARAGQKRHVWVMTRDDDGSVTKWELSTARSATLPARWAGKPGGEAPLRTTPQSVARQRDMAACEMQPPALSGAPARLPVPRASAACTSSRLRPPVPTPAPAPAQRSSGGLARRLRKAAGLARRPRKTRMLAVSGGPEVLVPVHSVSSRDALEHEVDVEDAEDDELDSLAADDEAHNTTGWYEEEDTGGGLGIHLPFEASGASTSSSAAFGSTSAHSIGETWESALSRMSISALKQLLVERGIDSHGCVEKEDLIERLAKPLPSAAGSRHHVPSRARRTRPPRTKPKSHGARGHGTSLLADDVLLNVDWAMRGVDDGGDEVLPEEEVMRGFAEVAGPPQRAPTAPKLRSPYDELITPPASPPTSPPASPRAERHGADNAPARPPSLPYGALEAVFNQRNLYVPKFGTLDPAVLRYDFDDDQRWEPLLTNRLIAQGRPHPAHEPIRLPPCPDERRLREMERQIRDELVEQVVRARQALNTARPRVNRLVRLVEAIESGLGLFERTEAAINEPASEPTLEAELDEWRQQVNHATPPGSAVRGRPAHYTYTDAKRIRAHVLSTTRYAGIRRDGPLDYVVGVRCIGFFGGAVSVWVFFGVVDDFSAQVRDLKR